jgi:hypothetical protein
MLYDDFYNLSCLMEFIPILPLCVFKQNCPRGLIRSIYFLVFLKCIIIIISFTPIQYTILTGINVIDFVENIYLLCSFIAISIIYKVILDKLISKVFLFGTLFFVAILILNLFLTDCRVSLLNYGVAASNLVFSSYGLLYFTMYSKNKSTYKLKYFWLNIALLVYNSLMFFAMTVSKLIINDKWGDIQSTLWSIVVLSSILFNVFLMVFLYKNRVKNISKDELLEGITY